MAFHGTLQYSLEFHGPPRKLHGISWHSMELHNYFMELRGTPWHSMELHGYSMAFHGTPWILHGTPWHGTPWILHGYSVEVHGFPSISMEFHGGISHGILYNFLLVNRIQKTYGARTIHLLGSSSLHVKQLLGLIDRSKVWINLT